MNQRKNRPVTVVAGMLAGAVLFWGLAVEAGITGEMLAKTCAGCHGTNGISTVSTIPTIAGMQASQLQTVMADFRSGKRPSTIMGRLTQGYSDEEIALMAEFFAKQK